MRLGEGTIVKMGGGGGLLVIPGLMVTMGGPKLEHLTQIVTDSQW